MNICTLCTWVTLPFETSLVDHCGLKKGQSRVSEPKELAIELSFKKEEL
jgi:hypothetical protein